MSVDEGPGDRDHAPAAGTLLVAVSSRSGSGTKEPSVDGCFQQSTNSHARSTPTLVTISSLDLTSCCCQAVHDRTALQRIILSALNVSHNSEGGQGSFVAPIGDGEDLKATDKVRPLPSSAGWLFTMVYCMTWLNNPADPAMSVLLPDSGVFL